MEFREPIEYVGSVGIEERKHLLSRAIGTFMPSIYTEPFGYVQVESMLSGTPVITTDWGSFPEVNINGVSGYRCRTFADFMEAAKNLIAGKIDLNGCRKWGERFSFDSIAPKYEKFFQDVTNLYTGNGWYELRPETQDRIDALKLKNKDEQNV
jgi:glycosyltransferase involved in cell wall biosynthesis